MTTDKEVGHWFGFRFQKMSFVQWMVAGLLLCGIVFLAQWLHNRDLDARANVVRALFELPDGVLFSDIRLLNKSKRTSPRVDVVARFSLSDFNDYVLRLEKPLWLETIPRFGDSPLQPVSPRNIKWRSLPTPASVGTSGVAWSSFSADAVSRIRNGRLLCIALQGRLADQKVSAAPAQSRHYTARDCTNVPRTAEGITLILGALDFDTRTLHAMIR